MMKKILFPAVLAVILTVGCSRQPSANNDGELPSVYQTMPGDSTRYGLACDGCTDSVLVFMPYSADRLDTFDIITARQQHRVFGRPHIGDELAVIVNPEDTAEALTVINLETLRATWCYKVTPTLRNIDKMPQRMQRRMLERIPDSLRQQWLTPREYTFRLKRDHTAMLTGGMRRQTTTDDMSPVEFPAVKHYTEWRIFNGRLILKADTLAGFTQEGELPTVDTADIVTLRHDTLVLQFSDHTQGYYRKP